MIRGMRGLTARRLVTATLSAALLATGVGMAAPASAAPDCPSGYACAWGDRYYLTAGSQAKRVQFVNGISNMSLHYYAGTSAVSRRRGNEELLEGFAWGEVAQARSGAFVELFGDGGEVGLVVGDVGALGQVLTDQTDGALVGSALPR